MTTTDKIPIGKFKLIITESDGKEHQYAEIKFRGDRTIKLKQGDIITLDMIETSYESEAVRKVAEYLYDVQNFDEPFESSDYEPTKKILMKRARTIVDLVHEAEDADE